MDSSQNQPSAKKHPYDMTTASAASGRISSAELLQGRQQVEIEHAGDVYRLRLTRSGKLILTK